MRSSSPSFQMTMPSADSVQRGSVSLRLPYTLRRTVSTPKRWMSANKKSVPSDMPSTSQDTRYSILLQSIFVFLARRRGKQKPSEIDGSVRRMGDGPE